MQTNHFLQYENKLHGQFLKLFHSVESRRFRNRLGPKIYCQFQRFALIVLFKRSGKALRKFVAELPESRWVRWLGLKELPSKTSLHRWMQDYSATSLRQLMQCLLSDKQPSLMAIDATGIDSWQRSRHYERRIGSPYMPYAKLDLLVDTETLLIHDHVLRMKPRHDVIGAESIFRRTRLKGIKSLADKGYDSERLHEVARENDIELFAPVRKFSSKRPKGRFRRICNEGDSDYPQRNTVESAIHALKSQVRSLRSKLHYMKKREIAWNILVYNIERIIRIFAHIFSELLKQPYASNS